MYSHSTPRFSNTRSRTEQSRAFAMTDHFSRNWEYARLVAQGALPSCASSCYEVFTAGLCSAVLKPPARKLQPSIVRLGRFQSPGSVLEPREHRFGSRGLACATFVTGLEASVWFAANSDIDLEAADWAKVTLRPVRNRYDLELGPSGLVKNRIDLGGGPRGLVKNRYDLDARARAVVKSRFNLDDRARGVTKNRLDLDLGPASSARERLHLVWLPRGAPRTNTE